MFQRAGGKTVRTLVCVCSLWLTTDADTQTHAAVSQGSPTGSVKPEPEVTQGQTGRSVPQRSKGAFLSLNTRTWDI